MPLELAAGVYRLETDYLHAGGFLLSPHLVVDGDEVTETLGTKLGAYGGVNLQTTRVARAHLDKLTRDGELAPRWFPVGDHTTRSSTS